MTRANLTESSIFGSMSKRHRDCSHFYFLAIALAELVTVFVDPIKGIAFHSVVLFVEIPQASFITIQLSLKSLLEQTRRAKVL